jgi:hypothetical protein
MDAETAATSKRWLLMKGAQQHKPISFAMTLSNKPETTEHFSAPYPPYDPTDPKG